MIKRKKKGGEAREMSMVVDSAVRGVVKGKLPVNLVEKIKYVVDCLEMNGMDLVTIAAEDPRWFYVNFVKPMLPRNVSVISQGLNVKITRYGKLEREKEMVEGGDVEDVVVGEIEREEEEEEEDGI